MTTQQQSGSQLFQAIDEKKLNVLQFLFSMQTLTTHHLKILVYTKLSMRTAYRTMNTLVSMKLIAFHEYGNSRGIGNCDRLYFLTKKGFDLVTAQQNGISTQELFSKHPMPLTIKYYEHRKKILDFWVVAIMETKKYQHTHQLISFAPELQRVSGQPITIQFYASDGTTESIKPDASFILRNLQESKDYLYFLEADMGTESLSSEQYPSLQQKVDKYQMAFEQLAFQQAANGFEKFVGARVLIVTTAKKRVINMLRTLAIQPQFKDAILFSIHDEIWWHGILKGRWAKQGCGDAVGLDSKAICVTSSQ